MKYRIISLCSLLMFFCVISPAQDKNVGVVFFDEVEVSENEGILNVNLMIRLDNMSLHKQDLVIITPVLQEKTGDNQVMLAPVAVAGRVRHKAVERSLLLDNYPYGEIPSQYVLRTNGEKQSLAVEASFPFEEWMYHGQLTFMQTVTGCRDCPPCYNEYRVAYKLPEPVIPVPPVMPRFELALVTPEAEPVKRRSESHRARLSFAVGKHDLIRDYADNAAILREVDKVISEIISDEDLTVEQLKVTGYASPEGNYDGNMRLSQNRALAFVTYLAEQHNLPEAMIGVDWKGEDWEGLRAIVDSSDLAAKSDILSVIDNNENIARRKSRLQALKGGSVYRELLKDYYPQLRRNDYVISFVARPFDIEEAKKLIKTKPQYLSLNEMFLVANSYPTDSEDFREVFDIAVRMFPDNETARINCAAQEIEVGLYERAMRRMEGIATADAVNNLGVIHARLGNIETAESHFLKAAAAGSSTASENLTQLKSFEQAQKDYEEAVK